MHIETKIRKLLVFFLSVYSTSEKTLGFLDLLTLYLMDFDVGKKGG